MKRVGTLTYALSGILCLALVLTITGIGPRTATTLAAAIQKVTVAGGSIQAVPGAPGAPVQFGGTIQPTKAAGEDSAVAYTVPAGKRLVIEFVSVDFDQFWSNEYVQAGFKTGNGPVFVVPVFAHNGKDGIDFAYSGSELTKVYAKAGETLTMWLSHGALAHDPPTFTFAFSGYLIKA